MRDQNNDEIKEGQVVMVYYYGQTLFCIVSSVKDNEVYFSTREPKAGQPTSGSFNKIEASRYLTILK